MSQCKCHTDACEAAVTEAEGCGCGHEHGAKEASSIKWDVIAIAAAALTCVAAIAIPQGMLKTAALLAAVLTAGLPIFWQGVKNICKLDLDELALLTVAVTAAILIGELPEAVMVTVLFRAGELLEDIAVMRSKRGVEAVTNIIPENANLILEAGGTKTVSARTLKTGDKLMIKSGERVPVDCVVLSGVSSVDTSSLTGESAPREIAEHDALMSGAVNMGGVLTCEATSTFDNSTASKIVQMVKDSAAKKGTTEKIITRFARVYTPAVIIMAVLVAVLPPLFGFGSLNTWIGRSLVFLVASCPCALVIATPLAFFAGIGGASKQGILVKGSKYIEVLANAKAVVFDKTGTLTTGALVVDEVFALGKFTRDDVLRLAAVCESRSNHPVAKAVVKAAPEDYPDAEACEEITAYGMRASIGNDELLCGSSRLMGKFGVDISALPEANVYVAKNSVAIGAVSVFDSPRSGAAEAIAQLRDMGVDRTAMLTGDAKPSAEKAAALIGIEEIHAGLLPQDKVDRFMRVKSETHAGKSLFVGDGINDSPVIAAADAGVAMGIASDAALESADVVLLSDKLTSLPQVIRIAKRTVSLAKCNIAFALSVKFAVFALAFFGMASMWLAVFADVGVSILSVLNAARALRFK